MKVLLNTMYITQPDMYLSTQGDTIVVLKDKKKLLQRPFHEIQDIVLFTYLGMSPELVRRCLEHGIGIAYMTPHGRLIGRLQSMSQGNILLRRTQYRIADDSEKALKIVKPIIAAKIYNEKWTVERYIRQYSERINITSLQEVSKKLTESLQNVASATSMSALRGLEGNAQAIYFSCFDTMILNQKAAFQFKIRSRRPPLTRVNALLSFLYAVLSNDIASALETVGLDAYAGFMHVDRPGRISLALDLVEEFRAALVDRFVLSIINRKLIGERDFIVEDNGAVFLNDTGRRLVLSAWQKRKQELITHPFLNEKMSWGILPFIQASLLARYLRQDLDAYPAFFWK